MSRTARYRRVHDQLTEATSPRKRGQARTAAQSPSREGATGAPVDWQHVQDLAKCARRRGRRARPERDRFGVRARRTPG